MDMGGTSFDVSLIAGGRANRTTEFEIEWGLPVHTPMVDVRTIGAGGGSIAWIDKGGLLRVGPQSAGREPGPGLLRPRRRPSHGHGRQPRARPDQPRLLPRRRARRSTSMPRSAALDAARPASSG